ncbi:hypothetical protein A7985_00695 [Pseudoalteromonas luteoviolacea]|uniref:Uncharacterized protein n=1 Tax=Pseudoalteromonas luteoviolacea TaxID=43657 RepID=A0A1C0TT59_9GAMM|nr:hypothetical protein [Pseudoalteromonas luteoviolacea]OCQ22517.1 hypothetical protein A7985_00695 [Pseudoalteromonas luteoviolacea]
MVLKQNIVNFKVKIVLLFALSLFNYSAYALSLADVSRITQQVNALSSQPDKGLDQIPQLVTQLNALEAEYQNERLKDNANLGELEKVNTSILSTKLRLSNHVYEQRLYSALQNSMIELASETSTAAIAHKSFALNIFIAGPSSQSKQYFTRYLNDEMAGGFKLREAILYFTFHPNNDVEKHIKLLASEKVHPIFRGPASWVFGKLSSKDDSVAIAQLTRALNQSILDNYGFETKILGVLGLAEVASLDYFKANFTSVGLDKNLQNLGVRYITFKRANAVKKQALIVNTYASEMNHYERAEAIAFILENNLKDVLKQLKLLVDSDKGLIVEQELSKVANILGYSISGSADNPIISIK